MPETAQSGDDVIVLLRQLVTNQAGVETVRSYDDPVVLLRKYLTNQGGSETANTNDEVIDLLRKILTNQAGAEVVNGGDGEYDLWRKILLNQGGEETALVGDSIRDLIFKLVDNQAASGEPVVNSSLLVSDSSDAFIVGIPQNNPAFFDGTRYWFFYQEGAVLKCRFGTSLASLSDAGATNVSSLGNAGKMYSVVFGQVAGVWYAWVLYYINLEWRARRWTLSESGLASPVSYTTALSQKEPGAGMLWADYGSAVVGALYGSIWGPVADAVAAMRSMPVDISTSTSMVGYNPANVVFPEHVLVAKLSDGFVSIVLNEGDSASHVNGNFGRLDEAVKTLEGDAWGAVAAIGGNVTGAAANDGDFRDQNYAADTSHTGQQDFAQTDDGKIWCAYIRNNDLTNGNFGRIVLVERGAAKASGWTLRSNDVIGSSGMAWHLAITTDGTDIWIAYCKDVSGVRAGVVQCRKYTVATDTFGSEITLGTIQVGHTFERLAATRRAANGQIPFVWSEKQGTSYDMVAATIAA